MTWGFVAAAAVTVVGGMISQNQQNKKEKKAQLAANESAFKDYTNAVNRTMENNRAIGEANTVNMIRTGYKASLLQLQTAKLKEQAAVEGWGVSTSAAEALSNAEATSAASGTVGSSVSAVSLDIRKKSAEAQIAVDQNWEDQRDSQIAAMNTLLEQGFDAQQSAQSIPDINAVNTGTYKGGSLAAAGAASFINAYAGSKYGFGSA